MQVAIVETSGDIRSVRPREITSVLPLGDGSVVTLDGGQSFASVDSIPTLRRRLHALPWGVPGRDRALGRLWVVDLQRVVRWIRGPGRG